jgi:voltage-gated potassium channel Kch
MTGWGPSGDRWVRLVFANNPVARLVGLGERFAAALAQKLSPERTNHAVAEYGAISVPFHLLETIAPSKEQGGCIMALHQSSEALRRPRSLLRLSFPVVTLASLALGYLGLGQFLGSDPAHGHRPIDLIYYDLQLFVLGSDPLQDQGPYPPMLEFARFLAPTATIYALFEAGRMLFAVELSRFKARRARRHAIVVGDTAFADALSLRLQGDGIEVIEVRTQVDEFVTAGEPLRIIGDARDPRVLQAAGIRHADAVYACAPGSAVNAAIAMTACRTRSHDQMPLAVYSHIPDPDLCATFQATFLGRPQPEVSRLDFFNINHIAARRLFAEEPVLPMEDRAPRLLVAGVTGFGTAVVVAAARSWRVARTDESSLPVTLAGQGATERIEYLVQRFPFLMDVCRFTARDADLLPLLAVGAITEPPDRLVVCHRDEEHALKVAMAAERSWRGLLRSVVVRLDGLTPFLGQDGPLRSGPEVDSDSDVLRAFGVVAAACDPELIREDLVERLAHVIHDRYRQARRLRGEWVPGDPSLEPWDRLSPRLRQTNRAQAEDIGRKLAQINCAISPRFGPDGDIVLSESDVERLARVEHERWCREHESAGWHYDRIRSEERRLHPGLLPWPSLPTQYRRRNHDAIRELSDILADAGFRIVRG